MYNNLVCAVYRSLSVELEPSWCCVSVGWNEVEDEASFEQRAGISEDSPMFRLHCAEKPRPERDHAPFNNDSSGKRNAAFRRHSHELLLSVWSRSECSSCRILSMVCFLSWSSWSLVSLALAAVASGSRSVWGPEAEWSRGLC